MENVPIVIPNHINGDSNYQESQKPSKDSSIQLIVDTSGKIHSDSQKVGSTPNFSAALDDALNAAANNEQPSKMLSSPMLTYHSNQSSSSHLGANRVASPHLSRLLDDLNPMTALPSPMSSPIVGPTTCLHKDWKPEFSNSRDVFKQPSGVVVRSSSASSIPLNITNQIFSPNNEIDEIPKLDTTSSVFPTELYGPYLVVRKIGDGSFSTVKLGLDINSTPDNPRYVALKMIEQTKLKESERYKASVEREIEVLRALDHPHIVKLFDVIDSHPIHHCLVLEYVSGGELWELVNQRKRLPEYMALQIFIQLLDVIDYLHSKNIIHRDLKLENILLVAFPADILPSSPGILNQNQHYEPIFNSPTNVSTKVTDFGLARYIDPINPLLTTRCGSEEYAAPELLMGQAYDGRKTDIWALGVILYTLLVGTLPFVSNGKSRKQFWYTIAAMQYKWPSVRPSPEAVECVDMILKSKDKRATIDQLRRCAWISKST